MWIMRKANHKYGGEFLFAQYIDYRTVYMWITLWKRMD